MILELLENRVKRGKTREWLKELLKEPKKLGPSYLKVPLSEQERLQIAK